MGTKLIGGYGENEKAVEVDEECSHREIMSMIPGHSLLLKALSTTLTDNNKWVKQARNTHRLRPEADIFSYVIYSTATIRKLQRRFFYIYYAPKRQFIHSYLLVQ